MVLNRFKLPDDKIYEVIFRKLLGNMQIKTRSVGFLSGKMVRPHHIFF